MFIYNSSEPSLHARTDHHCQIHGSSHRVIFMTKCSTLGYKIMLINPARLICNDYPNYSPADFIICIA